VHEVTRRASRKRKAVPCTKIAAAPQPNSDIFNFIRQATRAYSGSDLATHLTDPTILNGRDAIGSLGLDLVSHLCGLSRLCGIIKPHCTVPYSWADFPRNIFYLGFIVLSTSGNEGTSITTKANWHQTNRRTAYEFPRAQRASNNLWSCQHSGDLARFARQSGPDLLNLRGVRLDCSDETFVD